MDPADTAPTLWEPYADGTMGQQGDASADTEPARRTCIPIAYQHVAAAGPDGATSLEIEHATGHGHGGISGALSNLHRTGTIARLTARRGRHSIYVLPEHIGGRPTSPYNRNKKHHPMQDTIDRLTAAADACAETHGDHWTGCWQYHAPCAFREAARIIEETI